MRRTLSVLLCVLLCLSMAACAVTGTTDSYDAEYAIAYCELRGLIDADAETDATFTADMANAALTTLVGEDAATVDGDVTADVLASALDSSWTAPDVGEETLTVEDAAVVLSSYVQENSLPVAVATSTASTTRDGVSIPTFITIPASYDGSEKTPLTVMCHGHGGNHNEWGGFDAISNGLAAKGILVVTMDYPGCGDSAESFTENTMTNMKNDTLDVLNAMISEYNADAENYAFFGYSMGGRITLELLAEESITPVAVNLVAPAEDTEDLKGLFGGADSWDGEKAEAEANGYFEWTTIYGQEQQLSYKWFTDLEIYSDDLVEQAAAKYTGPTQVIWATDDEAVAPAVSQHVAEVMNATVLNTNTEGHSYSFYGTDPEVISTVNDGTIDFLAKYLVA